MVGLRLPSLEEVSQTQHSMFLKVLRKGARCLKHKALPPVLVLQSKGCLLIDELTSEIPHNREVLYQVILDVFDIKTILACPELIPYIES
jgi:hypothetical protein